MYHNFSDSILFPKLIRVKDNLILAKFELMKILPAKHIVEIGIRNHQINPEIPIVETSSGTFALGLGIVCAELGIPFFIISDPAIDHYLERRLIQLGGKVQIIPEAFTQDNPQIMRLNVLKEYLKNNPGAYWTRQYDNLENQDAYAVFAEYLVNELGDNFTLVGAVGSGGSTCGTIKKIRDCNPSARLIGVDTFGSVLFGLVNKKRILRGLGNSLLPKNLCHYYFDEVHWVSANDAFFYTKKLNSEMAIFCGPTTGATYQVAKWVAKKNPNELVVFMSADTGCRYQGTVYSDAWLSKNNLCSPPAVSPIKVYHPLEVGSVWSYFEWKRRRYEEVITTP
ncbi:MAG: pyridoxal-phosphate dependent enzyme [Gammaproteobacteria bacterium]|nr:MAG: pyridoxal-phosphate dependent enzyme [Gammaproteobacteria bacterium]